MTSDEYEAMLDTSTERLREKCQVAGLLPLITICTDFTNNSMTVIADTDLSEEGVAELLIEAAEGARKRFL